MSTKTTTLEQAPIRNLKSLLTIVVPFPLVDVGVGVLLRDAQDAVDGVGRPVEDVVVDHARAGHAGSGDGLADRAGRAATRRGTRAAALRAFGRLVPDNSGKKRTRVKVISSCGRCENRSQGFKS